MDEFTRAVKHVEDKCSSLLASQRFSMSALPEEMPLSGIYLLSESSQALYVGRTNTLRKRLQSHVQNDHRKATFAFLLAREETGRTKATYRTSGSRSDLLGDAAFRAAFDAARNRIRRMDIQFIKEPDPTRQALLEICAALRTQAKYNGFDNH